MKLQETDRKISCFKLSAKPEISGNAVLLDIDYIRKWVNTEEQPELVLYLRDMERKRHRIMINDFLPYFYTNATRGEIIALKKTSEAFSSWFVRVEQKSKLAYSGADQVPVLKVCGKQPWLVPQIREIIRNKDFDYYEADIPFTHRFLIDTGLYGLQAVRLVEQKMKNCFTLKAVETEFDPRIMSFDIEIDSSQDSDELHESMASIIQEADRRITAISLWWGHSRGDQEQAVFVLDKNADDSEKRLIEEVLTYIWEQIDPDIIVTYNGEEFDFPYLLKRMASLEIPEDLLSPYQSHGPREPAYGKGWIIPGVMVYDLFKRTRWLYTEDGSRSLDSVAKQLLNKSKIQLDLDHGEIWHKALEDGDVLELFEKYALRDAELTYQLFFAMNLSEWIEAIRITGPPPSEAMYFTERQTGEFLVFRFMYDQGVLIPPAPTTEEREVRKRERINAKGGLVFEPTRDLATAVLIGDFTSMYPSIMAAHNVGAESFLGGEYPAKERFAEEPQTTMAKMQEFMLEKRVRVKERLKQIPTDNKEEIKKLREYNWALKMVANSTFGSYNFIGSRFYDTNIAGSITEIGRTYLREVSQEVRDYGEGYDTIYGDTDSVFIETPLKEKVLELWKKSVRESLNYHKTVPEINDLLLYLQEILPDQLRLELEDIAYRILFHKGAKKRYTYISAITKQIKIVGLEAIRHDWSPFAKEVQRKAIDVILKTGDLQRAKEEIISYIRMKTRADPTVLKTNVTTYGPIKRRPGKYKSTTPAVAAFQHYAKGNDLDPTIAWKYFEYFPYIIIKGNGPLKDRARHPDYDNHDQIDLNHYISRSLAAINRFNVDISLEEVNEYLYGDLEEYFSS